MQMIARRAGSVPFDPFYDPMTARGLGPGSDYAPTYWIDTAGPRMTARSRRTWTWTSR